MATNFTETSNEPAVVDHRNLAIKLVLQGQEVAGCIIDGGSGVNVISAKTCEQLGISDWEACPFWLRMADTRSVRPLGLIRKLGIIIGGHRFEISAVVLSLNAPGAYPILLGRPWLRSANIKQSWKHNCISFRRGRTKVRVPTEELATQPKKITPLYAEDINMLEGVDDAELEAYLEEHPRIIPLFEIDVIETAADYSTHTMGLEEVYEPHPTSIMELSRAREAFEKEMEISRRVTASALEEINVGTTDVPRLLSITKDLMPREKMAMIELLREFKDVFAWSHEDMRGMDPKILSTQD